MFRRKKGDEGGSDMTDTSDGLGSAKPAIPPGPRNLNAASAPTPRPLNLPPIAPAAGAATTMPPAPTPLSTARPGDMPPRRAEGHGPPIIPTPKARETEQRRLIVGREISLTGEITSCDRLIVEGNVEANLNNCREVEIAETGLLKGSASIDDAEIRGRFEGNLTVKKRLLIKGTGKVSGLVRYGQLEVELGGQISGDIQAQPGAEEEFRPQRTILPTALHRTDGERAADLSIASP